jgi:hypothetical protein
MPLFFRRDAAAFLGVLLGPPSLANVVLSFGLSQLPQFVGRIAQDSEKDAASGVLTVRFALIGQTDHLFRYLQSFDDMAIAGSHSVFPPAGTLPHMVRHTTKFRARSYRRAEAFSITSKFKRLDR